MALASVTLKIDSYFGFSQDYVAFGSGEGGFRIRGGQVKVKSQIPRCSVKVFFRFLDLCMSGLMATLKPLVLPLIGLTAAQRKQ